MEEDEIKAAALHCVALDDAGEFPADRVLAVFEVAPALDPQACDSHCRHQPPARDAKDKRILDARMEFIVRQRYLPIDEGDGGASVAGRAVDVVSVKLEIALEAAASSGRPVMEAGSRDHVSSNGEPHGESSPGPADIEEAVAGAVAAVGMDYSDANGAIAALACWNLKSSTPEEEVDNTATGMRVELIAAFGDKGDWFTAEKTVALTRECAPQHQRSVPPSATSTAPASHDCYNPSGSTSNNHSSFNSNRVQFLRASFDWTPTKDMWDMADGPVVADVKVYGTAGDVIAADPQTGPWAGAPSSQHLLLLQASLCKKRMPWVLESGMKRVLNADVAPYIEQPAHARRHACKTKQDTLDSVSTFLPLELATTTATSWVVSEMDDPEWTTLEEDQRRRSMMEALNALPRWSGWTPGMWKKRRQRRQKQEEEKERRRAREAAERRGTARAERGGGAVGSKDGRGGIGSRLWRAWRNLFRRKHKAYG